MDKLEYVRSKLEDKECHAEATFKTDITINTFKNILAGERNPHKNTINTLYAYFKRKEK